MCSSNIYLLTLFALSPRLKIGTRRNVKESGSALAGVRVEHVEANGILVAVGTLRAGRVD